MDESTGSIRWLVVIHLALMLCLWLLPLMMYQDLPDTVAIHFDAHGEPDSYAAKTSWSLWGLPLVGAGLGLMFLVIIRFPRAMNHPRQREVAQLPEHLRPQVYAILIQMMLVVALVVDVLFLVIEYGIFASAKSGHLTQSVPVILALAALPIVLIIYYLPRIGRTIDRLKRIADTNSPSPAQH